MGTSAIEQKEINTSTAWRHMNLPLELAKILLLIVLKIGKYIYAPTVLGVAGQVKQLNKTSLILTESADLVS